MNNMQKHARNRIIYFFVAVVIFWMIGTVYVLAVLDESVESKFAFYFGAVILLVCFIAAFNSYMRDTYPQKNVNPWE